MRWIFRLVSALVVVALFAVGAVAMLPAERIAGLVADQFKAATGRDLTIQGDIRPSVWPELGIKTGEITVSNAEWSNAGPMIQAQGLSIGVDIQALWGGAIRQGYCCARLALGAARHQDRTVAGPVDVQNDGPESRLRRRLDG